MARRADRVTQRRCGSCRRRFGIWRARRAERGCPRRYVPRIAFQGELGAFSEEAVVQAFGADAEPLPCRENRDVAKRVASGVADAGVLPVENTLAGSVPASYDAILAEPNLHVVRELAIPIHHCVLGCRG